MDDEYKTERVFAVTGAADFQGGHPMPRRRAYRPYGSPVDAPHFDEADVASVLGLPVHVLTPDVLAKLQKLLAEASQLRAQLDVAQHHRQQLEDHADHYPDLPGLNGHAFVRELDAFLRQAEPQQVPDWGQVAVIHVTGIEAVAETKGFAAARDIQRQVWDRLHQSAMAGEPLACLGHGAFCWLLIGPDAQRRLTDVVLTVQQTLFPVGETTVTLAVSAGLAPLISGQGAESALNQADANRTQLPA